MTEFHPLLLTLAVFAAVVFVAWLIRVTERRDWRKAQEETERELGYRYGGPYPPMPKKRAPKAGGDGQP